VRPGEPVRAEHFNLLLDAVLALSRPKVGPGLRVTSGAGGVPVIGLAGFSQDRIPVVITKVNGPQPGPAYPEQYTYDYVALGNADFSRTGQTPARGRPAINQEAAIYPAEVGARAWVVRYRDADGEIAGADLEIPSGGGGAAPGGAHGFRGERLAYTECDGAGFQPLLDQVLAALGHVDAAAPSGDGRPPPPGGGGSNPMTTGTNLINVRQQEFAHAMLRLDIVMDAVRVPVPPQAIGASLATYLLQGDGAGSHTWSSVTLTVKAIIGDGQPVHFPIARTIPAGGGMLNPPLSEADLLGVSELHIAKDASTEASGSLADIDVGFAVMTPASAGPGGEPPVPDRIPKVVFSGAAVPAGPAAPAGD